MASKFNVYKDKGGEYRWKLVHQNGNIVADSGEGYSSKANAMKGIQTVKKDAPDAPIEEQTEEW